MTVALRLPMSREEFLDWDGHRAGRHEFDGVAPVAMTGGSLGHSRIIGNLVRHLGNRLAGSSCQQVGPEAGVATVGNAVRYPDAVVTCSPVRPDDKLVPEPVVVFEVVSPGSARTDRVTKLNEYAAVPSIRRYVIVEPDAFVVTVLSRTDGNGPFVVTAQSDPEVLLLPEIGVALPVVDIYEGVLTPPSSPEPARPA